MKFESGYFLWLGLAKLAKLEELKKIGERKNSSFELPKKMKKGRLNFGLKLKSKL